MKALYYANYYKKMLYLGIEKNANKTITLRKNPYKTSIHTLTCWKHNNQIDAGLELETEKRRERPKFFDCIRDMSNLDQVWQLPTKMKDKREKEV